MIFTGFTDVNGNVIPVQGAGAVYNEEKNSLALGKETVAIGQDQLVFGRKNVADATKAEIAGGAYYNNGDIVNIVDAYEGKARKEIFLGRTPQEVISTFKSLSCITDASSFQFRVGTGSQVQEDILARYGDTIKGYVLTISANYIQRSGVYKIEVGGRINAIISSYTNSIDGVIQYPVLDSAANVFTEYITDGLSSDAAILEALNTAINTTHMYNPNVEVIALYSDARSANVNILQGVTLEAWSRIVNGFNIRTLDWQGNQWNAGDITCDDGHGNTISMRDLLSRIAMLEAAANS